MAYFPVRRLWLLAALFYLTKTHAQVLNKTGSDAKLTPSVTGNSSLGNISNPNLFDGSTTVSVPIYSYATDAGDFGISLSYNTKGIKVDELAEHVGVHWSLNAGGTITRVLKDLPDETWDRIYQTTGMPNEPIPYPMIGRMYWYNLTAAEVASQQNNRFHHDSESDDFIVSVGSLSFTFNIGKNGQVFSHPHTNARVRFLRDGAPITMPTEQATTFDDYGKFSFIITDTEGNNYYFEKGSIQEKNYYDARFDALDPIAYKPYISQWVITKIILANGAQITYNYINADAGSTPMYQSFIGVERTNLADDPRTATVTASGSFLDLSSINYPNGVTATFIYHNNPGQRCDNPNIRMLDRIKVGTADQAMQYRLNHVYALSKSTVAPGSELLLGTPCLSMVPAGLPSTLGHRLRLKSIDILSADGTVSEPYYSFGYNITAMPRRLHGGQDFFGYSNGLILDEYVAQKLVPFHKSITSGLYYGLNKAANAEAIKAGNLTSVSNAYGGKFEFTYEAHQLMGVLTGLPADSLYLGKGQPDGLRLKSIKEADRFYPGNAKVTTFYYSGGQIFLDGGYFHYPVRMASGATSVNEYNIGNIYASPHQLISGSNHGYGQVTAEVTDQNGQFLSRKVSTFSNFRDGAGNPKMYVSGGGKQFFEFPFSDKQYIRDWEIGLPLSITEYDLNNRIISARFNYYRTPIDSSAKAYVYNTKKMETVPDNWDSISYTPYHTYAADNYSPYTGVALLDSTVSLKYVSDNSYINDVIAYTYDSRNKLKTTLTRNSEGEYIYTRNVYNYELSGLGVPQSSPFGTTLWYMNDAGLEKMIGQERWLRAGSNSPYSDLLLDASSFGFRIADNGYWVTNWMHKLVSGAPVSYTNYTGISGPGSGLNEYGKIRASYDNGGTAAPSGFQRVSEVLARDAGNNPVEVKLLGEEKYNAMIWDVATGNKLTDVPNARYSEIGYTGFESSTKGNWSYDQGLVQASSLISGGVVTGSFALRATSTTVNAITHNGLVPGKKYIISFWGKGILPKITGGGLGNIAFTALSEKGDWKYYEGAFTPVNTGEIAITNSTSGGSGGFYYLDELRLFPADAQMATATFDPLYGKTSATDAAGRVSYMEYDKLGRLVIIRDQEGNILTKTEYQVYQ